LALPVQRLESAYKEYQEYHQRAERIDSAITIALGGKYLYSDNETPLHTRVDQDGEIGEIKADLVYVSKDRRAILFVEESTDPKGKLDQMKGYANITPQSLQMVSRGEAVPSYDVLFFFPDSQELRASAMNLYLEVANDSKPLGHKTGISFWQHSPNEKSFKCVGGCFSDYLKRLGADLTEFKIKRYGSFPLLKRADAVSILQHVFIKAVESGYSENLIEFDKKKLTSWLNGTGIRIEKLIGALQIGVEAGVIVDFSPDPMTGRIAYTKPSSNSIRVLKRYTSDFFSAIKEMEDQAQKSLLDFAEIDKIEEVEVKDEEPDEKEPGEEDDELD